MSTPAKVKPASAKPIALRSETCSLVLSDDISLSILKEGAKRRGGRGPLPKLNLNKK